MPTLPTNAVVLRDTQALQAHLVGFHWSAEADLQDATDFGDVARRWVPGVVTSELGLDGWFDGTSSGIDEQFGLDLGAASGTALTVCPDGDSAVGKRAYLGLARLVEYTVSGSAGEPVGITARWRSEDRFSTGVVLAERAARTASGNGPSVDDGSSTTDGAVAALHVLSASGTSPSLTVRVQHSADGVVWADLITFDQVTAAASQVKAVAGPVSRYLRAVWTITGTSPSFTFAVSAGR